MDDTDTSDSILSGLGLLPTDAASDPNAAPEVNAQANPQPSFLSSLAQDGQTLISSIVNSTGTAISTKLNTALKGTTTPAATGPAATFAALLKSPWFIGGVAFVVVVGFIALLKGK